jgi:hypothetical protein
LALDRSGQSFAVDREAYLSLAESQVAAIRLAFMSKVLVMTGGPGVGKTTIVRAILGVLAAKGTALLLCAPTGRAAKRMTEATGFEAKTIHRLLEVDPKGSGFKRGEDHPLDCDLLVVDEACMVDVMLMQALLKAAPDKAALLIVGDIDQLPSVGPGQVLADVIASGAVPVVRLTEVFRQAAQSRFITSAHRINQGLMPDLAPGPGSDFYFVQADDPETAIGRIVELVKTRIPKRFDFDLVRDVQVLCPMNQGGTGARSLNIELQTALNPAGDRKVESLAGPSHYPILQRNLLYTGVTRGKRRVVLVGQEEGRGHRGAKCFGPAEVVEANGMATPASARLAAGWHGELSHGARVRQDPAGAAVARPWFCLRAIRLIGGGDDLTLYPSGSEGRQGFADRARSHSRCSEEPGLPSPPEDRGAELRCKHRKKRPGVHPPATGWLP